MEDQNWAVVLRAIYEDEITFLQPPWSFSDNKEAFETIQDRTGLGMESIEKSLDYLQTVGLLEQVKERPPVVALSKKGFQVAHEREIAEQERRQRSKQSKQQTESNYTVAYFTFGLLAVAAAEALIQAAIGAELSSFVIIAIGLGPAIMFLILVRKMQELNLFPEERIWG